jgi:4-amino-4-deoxy-L-arabinose transferase-like glycosyltransferase
MSGRRFAAGLAGLMLATAGLALWRADSVPMLGDEAFYALIADNIRRGGHWLYLQNWWRPEQVYLEKPPLIFWLGAATDWAIGYRPLAFRLWPGLLGCATALCTALIGRALCGGAAGLLAGLLLATHDGFLLIGARSGTLNSAITCCAAVALLAMVAPWGAARPGRAALVLAAAAAAAGWIKPFNGLILLGLALATALCQAPAARPPRLRAVALAAGPALVANLAWPALLWGHFGRPFLHYLLEENVWERFSRGVDPSHVKPWYQYVALLSWRFRLGWAAAALRLALSRGAGGPDAILCLVPLLWLVIVSLGASKLYQYLFPVLPLLAVAAGALLAQAAALLPARWRTAALALAAVVILGLGVRLLAAELAAHPALPWDRPGCPASDPPGRPVAVLLAGFTALPAVEAEGRSRELEFALRRFADRVKLVDAAGLAGAIRQGDPALIFLRRDGAAAPAAAPAGTVPLGSFPGRYGDPVATDVLGLGLAPGCR